MAEYDSCHRQELRVHLNQADTRVLAAQNEVESLQRLIAGVRENYYECTDSILNLQEAVFDKNQKRSESQIERLENESEINSNEQEITIENVENYSASTNISLAEEDKEIDWTEDPMN